MSRPCAADFTGLRRLRSGQVFSKYYVVPAKDFDLDVLGLAAVQNEQDEADLASQRADADAWEDFDQEPHPETSPQPRAPSSSPLSSLPSTPSASRAPSPSGLPEAVGRRTSTATQHNVKGSGRKRRSKNHSRNQRAKKRKVASASSPTERRASHARHILRAKPTRVQFDLAKASVTRTGYRGKYEKGIYSTYTLEELQEEDGFVLFDWDGRETVPIVIQGERSDREQDDEWEDYDPDDGKAADVDGDDDNDDNDDVVIGILAGCPSDGTPDRGAQQTWHEATDELADEIEEKRGRARFSKDASFHRRGEFGAEAEGISHGGGQTRPANLKHQVAMTFVLTYLVGLQTMVRIAHFGSATFANWAPEIHKYCGDTLTALLESDGTLARNFASSVWACITINFGPRTVTFPHRDYANLAFGWCSITALGKFDPDKGGHLVLWDLKMIIRFPAGSTIIIPSAILRHSNTRIGLHERRYSVTQYSAGALFRWVEHGFQLDEQYYASLSRAERAEDRSTAAKRWKKGRGMFSKLKDLVRAAEERLAK